jgi:predicted Zn-ribbon and HTH transcriptional regulator
VNLRNHLRKCFRGEYEMKTRREQIVDLLTKTENMTLQELADITKSSVKTVAMDMDSVRKTIKYDNKRIEVKPAMCLNCNYVFYGRGRVSDPHKCPECHSERISPQIFRIVSND